MKRVLIVEDNEKHMEALSKLLSNVEDVQVVKAYNMTEACYMLSLYEFSLFLIDIVLDTKHSNDVSGMKLVKHIREIGKYQFTPIIFITSLEDPKLCAYRDLHCYQYIEKPFDIEYVYSVIKAALKYENVNHKNDYAYFKKDGILYSVAIKDIVYIEINRRKIIIHTVSDCLELGYHTISEILDKLSSEDFFRCNRGTIINIKFIELVDYSNRYVKLHNIVDSLEIGPSMKKEFKKRGIQ